jgi:hypothetical protein
MFDRWPSPIVQLNDGTVISTSMFAGMWGYRFTGEAAERNA